MMHTVATAPKGATPSNMEAPAMDAPDGAPVRLTPRDDLEIDEVKQYL